MIVISEGNIILDKLKSYEKNKTFSFDLFETFSITRAADGGVYNESLKQLNDAGAIVYKNDGFITILDEFDLYIVFYSLYQRLEECYLYSKKVLINSYCISAFNKVLWTTTLSREVMRECIYNFISTSTIGINKLVRDADERSDLYIPFLYKDLKKYFDDNHNKEFKKLRNTFKEYLDSKKDFIELVNVFRNKFFAHADNDFDKDLKEINANECIDVASKILHFLGDVINLLADEMICKPNEDEKMLSCESMYVGAQLIKK